MSDNLCLHRKNPDDTWDSVCPQCALIIARAGDESELALFERIHVCDPAVFRKPPVDFRVFLTK